MVLDIPALPNIPPQTHKGQYGKVLVVGGSPDYYGAPILTALGAEHSGADLITLCIPKEHTLTAKNHSLNFFIKNFHKSILTEDDVDDIIHFSQNCHIVIIGNGLGKEKATQTAILKILEKLRIPVVIDAEALFPEILKVKSDLSVKPRDDTLSSHGKEPHSDWILTPHPKEFERVFETEFSVQNLKENAKKYDLTILVKGPVDYLATPTDFYENHTGCVQMRVGGTGDVLAGIVASYRAQGLNSLQATRAGIYYYGKAGEELATLRSHFSAQSLANFFSFRYKKFRG